MKIKYIIGCLYIIALSSCATLSKTDKAKTVTKPKAKIVRVKKISVEHRVNAQVVENEQISIQNPEDLNKMIESKMTEFKDSNLIANEYKNDFDRAIFMGKRYDGNIKTYTSMNFPIKSDYLVQLELFKLPPSAKESVYEALYTYWGMLHILSLGVVPITRTDKFNIRTTLFDKIGQVVRQKQTLNEARVWYWSPLFFINGLHMLASYREIYSSDIEIDSEKNDSSFPTTFLR